jgi:hypothetical protein
MGKLKPIGSEKLEGMDKINRMIEIARYKENIPNPINEDKSVEFNKTLADGNQYRIDKEKNGYVIKKSINESGFDYLEPMKNRKYYSSYSQAFKRLNLITKEVNSLVGNDSNISLFNEGEDGTRFFLKNPRGVKEIEEQVPAPVPAPAPAPAPAPSPEEMPSPEPEMPTDEMPSDMDMDMETEPDMEEDEVVTFKTIQKLTGKLAQKLRTLRENPEEPMSSKDIKYVINSVLSALDLDNLDEEDKEEIVNKFEGIEGEEGMDMGMEEMPDMGDEEMGSEEPVAEPSPEMAEEFDMSDAKKMLKGIFSETDDVEDNSHSPKKVGPTKLKVDGMKENEAAKVEEMIEGLFTESKIDKILKGYFKTSDKEKQINENRKQIINKIKTLSEGIEQEVMARKFFSQNSEANLLGKTKSKNLVFELNESKFRVTPKGEIL